MPNGARVKVAGRVILVHTPPTRSGVRVMFITAEDEFGLIDMVLFPNEQRTFAKKVLSEPIAVFEGIVRKEGRRRVSLVIERVQDFRGVLGLSENKESKRRKTPRNS